MKIGGIQKTSLLDFPDHISAIIWTVGCNFRCPFCYNPDLVRGKPPLLSEIELFDFLQQRQGMLEGVAISGGEPLLQEDLAEFLSKVKKLGYLVKLDTNGSLPKKLEELMEKNLVDYVAMDVKAPKDKYKDLAGVSVNTGDIQHSIDLLMKGTIRYEFRTTVIPGVLKKEDVLKIAQWIEGAEKYCLQQFKSDATLLSAPLQHEAPYSKESMMEIYEAVQPYVKHCELRGV